jgi:hypothetical protein
MSVTNGHIEAALTRRRQQRTRMEVGCAQRKSSRVVGCRGERREILDRAGEARVLDQERRMLGGECGTGGLQFEHAVSRRDHVHGDPTPVPEGSQHGDRLGMDGVGNRDACPAGCLHGDYHCLGCCCRAVVERGVGDIEPGERADHRLEFEDGLQRSLRCLGLVRRVCRVELGA